MAIENYDQFQFTIKCYNMSGFRRSCEFYKRFIFLYILYPLLLTVYILIIFNIRYQTNVTDVAAIFESLSTLGYLVTRKAILLFHASLFEEMIQDRSKFWHYDLHGKTRGDKFRSQMAFCVSLIKFMWVSTTISAIFRSYTPFYVEEYVVPEACYIPGNSIYSVVIIFVLIVIFYAESIFMFGVFDAFFMLMCVDLKIQFKLLNKTLGTINIKVDMDKDQEQICWRKLIECFEHHRFLLGVHKKLNKAFSEFFVAMYFFTIGGMCIQFFSLLDGQADINHLLKLIMYLLVINILAILVIIPSSNVEIEAEKLIFQIYNLDWYNSSGMRIRKFVLFWLIKAEIPVIMTGDQFQFIIKCYDLSGLRQSCESYKRIISVYILYPLLLAVYSLIIFNIRYQTNVTEMASIFESMSTLGFEVCAFSSSSYLMGNVPSFTIFGIIYIIKICRSADVKNLAKFLMYLLLFWLSFQVVMSKSKQAEKLIFEIYNIDWYSSSSMRIRKFILFWLIKAEIPVIMTGAEFLQINRNLLPQVEFNVLRFQLQLCLEESKL
ncbi:7tm 6 domain containing protein, partial [Asbolus verrucosus]